MSDNMAVLLLDSTYEPLRVINWQRAVYLIFSGKAEVVEESDMEIRSVSRSWKLPSVIRQFGKFKRRTEAQFSRINIYLRDAWTCQYCGKKKTARDLTFDHVVPRAQGGKTSWTNVVTACRKCNGEKADRTPKQAGMALMKEPIKPKWLPTQVILRLKKVPDEWKSYIDERSLMYWTTELESG
jgi:5-methylcytosine-specific restriction endonuclease McrA